MKKLLSMLLALVLVISLPVSALAAADPADIVILEGLVKDAEDARDAAEVELNKITDDGGYEGNATDANASMTDALEELVSVASMTDALDNAIEDAKDAVEVLKGAIASNSDAKDAAVTATDAALNGAVDVINEAVENVQQAIDNAEIVIENANLAVDAAAKAVESAELAMDKAQDAQELYLQILADAEGDIDATKYAKIAEAENVATQAWNAYADAQNVALDVVSTAVEKAIEARDAFQDLYQVWQDALVALEDAVLGTELEYVNQLRTAALNAAFEARKSAILAVEAASNLEKMATDAKALEPLFGSYTDALEEYTEKIETVIASATEVAEELIILPTSKIIPLKTSATQSDKGENLKIIKFEGDAYDKFTKDILNPARVLTFVLYLTDGTEVTFWRPDNSDKLKDDWFVLDTDAKDDKGSIKLSGLEKNKSLLVSFVLNGEVVYYVLTISGKDSDNTMTKINKIVGAKEADLKKEPVPGTGYTPDAFKSASTEIEKVANKNLTNVKGVDAAIDSNVGAEGLGEMFQLSNVEWDWVAPIIPGEEEGGEGEEITTLAGVFAPAAAPVAPPAPSADDVPYGELNLEDEVPYGMVKTGQGIEQQAMALGLGFVLISMGALIMKSPRKKNEDA